MTPMSSSVLYLAFGVALIYFLLRLALLRGAESENDGTPPLQPLVMDAGLVLLSAAACFFVVGTSPADYLPAPILAAAQKVGVLTAADASVPVFVVERAPF